MDLRVLVLTADHGLAELIRAQVENLGCRCNMAESYDQGSSMLTWADAAIVDLADDGLDALTHLRLEAPLVHVLAIAPEAADEEAARSAGADRVLVEPFSIPQLIEAVRALDRHGDAEVVDLRTGERKPAPAVDDAPWWATR